MMPMAAILLSTNSAPTLRWPLQAAGFTIVDHILGSPAAIDFEEVTVAIVEVGDRPDAAAAQTRRWRIERGDVHLPVIWVLPVASAEQHTLALDSGADVCLALPLEVAVLTAQVRAGVRQQAAFAHQYARGGEARFLGEQLQKTQRDFELAQNLARLVQQMMLPRTLPIFEGVRITVGHDPRGRSGGDFYDVARLDADHLGVFLADTVGPASGIASLIGTYARLSVPTREAATDPLPSPDRVLAQVHQNLLALGLDDPPFVAMCYIQMNLRTGEVTFARAGLPPPVYLPTSGPPVVWLTPGPYLGSFPAEYTTGQGHLEVGDRLLLSSDGSLPADAVQAAQRLAERIQPQRLQRDQEFVDALVRDLQLESSEPEDFTLMTLERVASIDSNPTNR